MAEDSRDSYSAPARLARVRAALALPVIAVAGVIGTWRAVDLREARYAEAHLGTVTEQAALRLEDFVHIRLVVLESVVEGVRTGALDTPERFVAYTTAMQQRIDGFLAINRVDAEGTLVWVSPPARNRRAKGKSVLEHPEAGPVARRAFETRKTLVTPPLKLFQGMLGFASYLPVVTRDGRFDGAVNGVFDAERLVLRALRSGLLDDYEVRVLDGERDVYRSPGFEAAGGGLSSTRQVDAFGRTWAVTLRPTPATAARLLPGSHHFWALLGVLACFGLGGLGLAWYRVAARANALSAHHGQLQEELRQAQKMEALGRLAGGLAHDFNNLLTALRGHADLALSLDDLDPEARLSLEDIVAVTKRGAEMTRGLLGFSRKQPDKVRRVDPGRRIRSLQRTLRHLLRESIQQDVDLTVGEGVVLMDPTQLDQVIMNLVVNAADAMPDGGRLGLRAKVEDEGWFLIEVEDTGMGIPKDVLDRVFEPFFTTKAKSGTGLGLAQVWEFANRAGGRVEVDSEPGEGTKVQVWLPRIPGGPDEDVASSGGWASPSGRVLLVEDDREVRETLGRLLRRAGFEVQDAGSVVEAWEIAMEGPRIDGLVSDVQLPDGTGPELGERLRARRPNLPMFFCSGNVRPEDTARIEALGATFFSKPFETDVLVRRLGEAIGQDHAQASSARPVE